jgi:hypothetical protein
VPHRNAAQAGHTGTPRRRAAQERRTGASRRRAAQERRRRFETRQVLLEAAAAPAGKPGAERVITAGSQRPLPADLTSRSSGLSLGWPGYPPLAARTVRRGRSARWRPVHKLVRATEYAQHGLGRNGSLLRSRRVPVRPPESWIHREPRRLPCGNVSGEGAHGPDRSRLAMCNHCRTDRQQRQSAPGSLASDPGARHVSIPIKGPAPDGITAAARSAMAIVPMVPKA